MSIEMNRARDLLNGIRTSLAEMAQEVEQARQLTTRHDIALRAALSVVTEGLDLANRWADKANNELPPRDDEVMLNGKRISLSTAAHYMDYDLREKVHAAGLVDEQEFIDGYAALHLKTFGERFEVA